MSHIDNAARNRNVLINIIRDRAPLSRKEISGISNLSIATTKRFIEDLLSENLIVEVGLGQKSRGRKASLLQLNGQYCHTIGVNVFPGNVEVVGIDFRGENFYERAFGEVNTEKDSILPLLRNEIGKTIIFLKKKRKGRLLGVGIGIAGLVNTRNGTVLYSPSMQGWENVNLSSMLEHEFHVDIIVDDSVRCMALSEKRYGEAKTLGNFLYIYIGKGVGSGLLLDGRIYRGLHGVAGEFGHITIRENGHLCNCGNRGCLEAHVSITPIIQDVVQSLSEMVHSSLRGILELKGTLTLEDILMESERGDKLANVTINNVSENTGTGIASLVNVFDPGVVILGGEVIDTFGEVLIEGVKRKVRLKAINAISSRTEIVTSRVKRFSAARGAATLLIEKFLDNAILNF